MLKKHHQIFYALATVSQLGLSILIPIALCIMGAGWLQRKFNLGQWVMLVGILLGIGSGICSLVNFIKMVQKRMDEEDE